MTPETDISAIAHVIQLSVAPVFLITGVAALLGVLAGRLGRIVDRARVLETQINSLESVKPTPALEELNRLSTRARLVNFAIIFATICILLTCCTIVTLFTGTFLPVSMSKPITVLFIAAMISLFLALLAFLREVIIATRALRISSKVELRDGKAAREHRLVKE